MRPDRVLSRDRVRDHIWQGTVVADRAGEDVRDAAPDALEHDPAPHNTLLDRGRDRAGPEDLRDRVEVVPVTVPDGGARREVHSERGPVEAALDVVGCERIACEEDVDVALSDEPGQGRARARMDDGGAADECDATALPLQYGHLTGDPADQSLARPLGRDRAVHELEGRGLARPFGRVDPDALLADHDEGSACQLREREALRRPVIGVDRDQAVHLDPIDGEPGVAVLDLGRVVRGRVEPPRCDPVGLGRLQARVLDHGLPRPEAVEVGEDQLEPGRILAGDGQARIGRVGLVLAHVELEDFE